MAFAQANGLQAGVISDMGEWIQFTTTVAHANALFNADYQTFVHARTAKTLTRTLAYSLPDALVGHVDTIIPTTSFDVDNGHVLPRRKLGDAPTKRATMASCDDFITPACLQVGVGRYARGIPDMTSHLQALYGIPLTPATDKNVTLLVTGYVDQWPQTHDLIVRTFSTCRNYIEP
jgi:tripeptidyl-peptidase-1